MINLTDTRKHLSKAQKIKFLHGGDIKGNTHLENCFLCRKKVILEFIQERSLINSDLLVKEKKNHLSHEEIENF